MNEKILREKRISIPYGKRERPGQGTLGDKESQMQRERECVCVREREICKRLTATSREINIRSWKKWNTT